MIKRILVASLLLVVLHSTQTHRALAQFRNASLPSPAYYSGFIDFYAADYVDALKMFERGSSSALKLGPDGRFMDSACYWTMAGECHYHLGNFPEAISYYEQALDLLLDHARGDWASRIGPQPDSIQQSSSAIQRAAITWYQSQRNPRIAKVPNSFPVFFGRLDAARALFEGGVLENPEIRAVDHREIMRCVALAIYRRGQIKGTTNVIDPFTNNLLSGLARLPTETPVIGKWNLLVRGLAEMSVGRHEKAVRQIKGGLQLRGGLDHDLTPIGLLALAQIAMIKGEDRVASQLAMEAAYSGAVFGQYDVVEEAFSLATKIHLAGNRTVPEPLAPAIAWAARSRTRLLQASLIVQLADCQMESNEIQASAETLKLTRRAMSGTDLGRTVLAARIRYLNAALAFMNFEDGSSSLEKSLEQFAPHSLWRYQLALTNNALAAGTITQRQAELVYEQLLVDPDESHWKYQPMDAMTYLTSPHVGSMEQWFEILLARRNHEKAIEVAERIRRHRFYASLPMSGRLLSLRWISTAPEALLTKESMQQREAIDDLYPKFRQSIERIEELRHEIRSLPLKPDADSPNVKKQTDLFVQQLKHARYQESVLRALALRRLPADFVFPATTDYSRLAKGIGPKQLVVSSLKTESGYHQYVMTQQTRRYLGVVRERDMRRGVSGLYKALGITDANNAIDANILKSTEWQTKASELKSTIFKNFSDDQWENFDELIVVPDGILWYVPFEILQTGAAAELSYLQDAVRIRYLPLISFTSGARLKDDPRTRVAVVTGKIHNKSEPELSQSAFEKLKDTLTNASRFSQQFKIPSSLFGSVIDTLLVWSDIKYVPRAGTYSIQPFQLDSGRNGSSLADWMNAPWHGPTDIVLPGFSSGSAGGLKSRSTGEEMFLLSCGFLASGARSILISRWRAGGQSSLDLSRDFVIRRRQKPAVDALHEANASIRKTTLDFDQEIRVKQSRKKVDSLTADHPFFWAGNMLVDLEGSRHQKEPDQNGAEVEADQDGDATPDGSDEKDDTDDPFDDSAKPDEGSGTKSGNSSGTPENQDSQNNGGSGKKGN